MTALWLDSEPRTRPDWPGAHRRLALIGAGQQRVEIDDADGDTGCDGLRLVDPTERARWHRGRTSPAVRRRRTLLAVAGLLVVGLALPLSGTGGRSHAAGSASAEHTTPYVYTVHSGDTLWSIAEAADPTADPRVLVARLAAETGSETVTPGERITVP
jgi:hypothetical protein